jgi:hypothetical protein
MSTKKINEALGIESIDSFLSSLNVDDDKIDQLNQVDEQVKGDIERIDAQMDNYKNGGIEKVNLDDISTSLGHIKELVDVSKETIRYIYQQIIDSELVDSELVGSFSKLLEAVHIQISEYIGLYKDRQNFYYKVKLEAIKQQNKLEQMRLKQEFDLEKIEKSKKNDAVTVDNMTVPYSQEDLIKQLDDADSLDQG